MTRHHFETGSGITKGSSSAWILRVASVGNTEAYLCRKGQAISLTRNFNVNENTMENQRVRKSGGIITEV